MKNELVYIAQTDSKQGTKQLGASLAPHLRENDLIVLSGDLGAGKTQFVQGVARGLGIEDAVTSPSFNILLSYESPGSIPLYHFDLYRLDTAEQLEDIAFYETVESGGVSFVEWGKKFPKELPSDYLELIFEISGETSRNVKIYAWGELAQTQLAAWAQDPQSLLVKCS